MRKIIISLIVILMVIGLSASITDIFALDDLANAEAGPYNDPNKEVTSINEDGTIVNETVVETSVATQSDSSSKESTNRYARAANGITSNSTAVVNFRTKSNSSINTEYKEDGTNRPGYVNGYYAADAAFLGFDNDANPTKVKFLQAGVIGWVNYSEVEVYNYTDSRVNTTSKYYVSNGRLYHGIVTNLVNNGYSSSLDCGPKPDYLQEGKTYFSYDGHYFYTYDTGNLTNAYAKMLSDYRKNVRTNAVNANDPYYNYYLYLSHRSVTQYSASELNKAIANFSKSTSKMRNLGQSFIDNQNKYGANALLMIGVAANESAWGSSNIAMTNNNLFGHAAYDSDPNGSANGYSSVEYSVYYHAARFVSKGYLDCITDSRYYGSFLGDKASGMAVKYASDPYWGEKAAAMAWKVDSYLGGKDAKKYTIGIKDTLPSGHSVIDIKASPSSSSRTLYKTYPVSSTTANKPFAPSNYAFIVLKDGQTNSYYKIQCDSEVNGSRTAIVNQEAYTFANSYGYIPANSVKIVSKGYDSITADSSVTPFEEGRTYYFKNSISSGEADKTVIYGKPTDEVYVGDWDGDGIDTLCVRRGSTYYFKNSVNGGEADKVVAYGKPTDEVYVGDWDGDGIDTLCVRRESTYYFKNSISAGEADKIVAYGRPTDEVYVGDWNGDGVDTLCVRRESTYYFKNSISAGEADKIVAYGRPTDEVYVGDWNGDGIDTLCVRRGSTYYFKNSVNGGEADKVVAYGRPTDEVYVGDWDGNKIDTLCVRR